MFKFTLPHNLGELEHVPRTSQIKGLLVSVATRPPRSIQPPSPHQHSNTFLKCKYLSVHTVFWIWTQYGSLSIIFKLLLLPAFFLAKHIPTQPSLKKEKRIFTCPDSPLSYRASFHSLFINILSPKPCNLSYPGWPSSMSRASLMGVQALQPLWASHLAGLCAWFNTLLSPS